MTGRRRRAGMRRREGRKWLTEREDAGDGWRKATRAPSVGGQ